MTFNKLSPAQIVKILLRQSRAGALATLMPASGDPYCSLVNVASQVDGSPLLLISRLAVHTKNLLADPRVSLMLDDRGTGDAMEGARIMLAGIAETADPGDLAAWRRRYLAAHPAAEEFVDFPDFLFVRIVPTAVHLVAGFGRIVDLSPVDFLTGLSDAQALIEAEPDIVDHMNADHRNTMNLYATQLLGREAGQWRCTGCDPEGIDLQDGLKSARLAFSRRIVAPAALRHILKELAGAARSAGPERY